LIKLCKSSSYSNFSEDMTHSDFDFFEDIYMPIRCFFKKFGFNIN